MKPKEYIKKYGLDQANVRFDHNSVVADLSLDFTSTVEFLNAKEQLNYERFKGVVKEIRQKFDSINNKSGGKLPEGLWNFFYASTIVKVRDNLFGDYLKQKKDAYEKKRADRERWHNSFGGFSKSDWYESLFRAILNGVHNDACFKILELEKTATKDDVINQFRKLSLQYHPDKGGSEEKMIEIIRAKNECLSYIGA